MPDFLSKAARTDQHSVPARCDDENPSRKWRGGFCAGCRRVIYVNEKAEVWTATGSLVCRQCADLCAVVEASFGEIDPKELQDFVIAQDQSGAAGEALRLAVVGLRCQWRKKDRTLWRWCGIPALEVEAAREVRDASAWMESDE